MTRCKNCGAPNRTTVCRYCDSVTRIEMPSLVISIPGELNCEQAQQILETYKRAAKKGDPIILTGGAKVTPLGPSPYVAGER